MMIYFYIAGGFNSNTMGNQLNEIFRKHKMPNKQFTSMDIIFLGLFYK